MRFSAAITAVVGAMFVGATMANSPSPDGPSPSGPGPELSSLEERSDRLLGLSPGQHIPGPDPKAFSPSPASGHPLVVRSDASSPSPAGPGPENSFFTGPKHAVFSDSFGPTSSGLSSFGPSPSESDHPLEVRSDAFSPSSAGLGPVNPLSPGSQGPEHTLVVRSSPAGPAPEHPDSPSPEHTMEVRSDAFSLSPAGLFSERPHSPGPEHSDRTMEVRSYASSPSPDGSASEHPLFIRDEGDYHLPKGKPIAGDGDAGKPINPQGLPINPLRLSKIPHSDISYIPTPEEQEEADVDLQESKAKIRQIWLEEDEFAMLNDLKSNKDKVDARAKWTPEQREAELTNAAYKDVEKKYMDMQKLNDERLDELNAWSAERQEAIDKKQARKDELAAQAKTNKAKKQEDRKADEKAAAEKAAIEKAIIDKIAADKKEAQKLAAEKPEIKQEENDAAAKLRAEDEAAKIKAEEKLAEEKKAAEKLATDKEAADKIKQEAEAKLAEDKAAAEAEKQAAAEQLTNEKHEVKQEEKDGAAKLKAEEEEAKKKEKDAEKLADHFNPANHGVTRISKPKSCSCFETFSHILGYETKTSGPMDKFRLDIWAVRNRHCIQYCTHPFSKSEFDSFRAGMKGKLTVPGNFPDPSFYLEAGASSGDLEKRGHFPPPRLPDVPGAPKMPSSGEHIYEMRQDIKKLKDAQVPKEIVADPETEKKAKGFLELFSGGNSKPSHKTKPTDPKAASTELSAAYKLWLVELKTSIEKERALIKQGDFKAHKQLNEQFLKVIEEAEKNFIKSSEEAAAAAVVQMRKEVFEDLKKDADDLKDAAKPETKKNIFTLAKLTGMPTPSTTPAGEVVDGAVSKAPVHKANSGDGPSP